MTIYDTGELNQKIKRLQRQYGDMMAQVDDLRAGEASLKDALTQLGESMQSKLNDMQGKIDALQTEVNNAPSAVDLSADVQALKDLAGQVATIGQEAPTTP